MTVHAVEEMEVDGLTAERCILTGEIVTRQKDRVTGESKYLVQGKAVVGGHEIVTVAKIGPTGKLVVVTVYVL